MGRRVAMVRLLVGGRHIIVGVVVAYKPDGIEHRAAATRYTWAVAGGEFSPTAASLVRNRLRNVLH
jgi:hypothetical protein